jgi:hypothetical protein
MIKSKGLLLLPEKHSQRTMSKQLAQQPIKTVQTNQTPFNRFQAATSEVLIFPKSSLQKSSKKKQ